MIACIAVAVLGFVIRLVLVVWWLPSILVSLATLAGLVGEHLYLCAKLARKRRTDP